MAGTPGQVAMLSALLGGRGRRQTSRGRRGTEDLAELADGCCRACVRTARARKTGTGGSCDGSRTSSGPGDGGEAAVSRWVLASPRRHGDAEKTETGQEPRLIANCYCELP